MNLPRGRLRMKSIKKWRREKANWAVQVPALIKPANFQCLNWTFLGESFLVLWVDSPETNP
jgi:hypothetical protein